MSTETTGVITAQMAVDAVNEILSSKRAKWEPVTADTQLDDLDLDSLEVAELFATLEDESGIDLDPDSAENLKTVGDLVNLKPF